MVKEIRRDLVKIEKNRYHFTTAMDTFRELAIKTDFEIKNNSMLQTKEVVKTISEFAYRKIEKSIVFKWNILISTLKFNQNE